jgi:hypothetical protein
VLYGAISGLRCAPPSCSTSPSSPLLRPVFGQLSLSEPALMDDDDNICGPAPMATGELSVCLSTRQSDSEFTLGALCSSYVARTRSKTENRLLLSIGLQKYLDVDAPQVRSRCRPMLNYYADLSGPTEDCSHAPNVGEARHSSNLLAGYAPV